MEGKLNRERGRRSFKKRESILAPSNRWKPNRRMGLNGNKKASLTNTECCVSNGCLEDDAISFFSVMQIKLFSGRLLLCATTSFSPLARTPSYVTVCSVLSYLAAAGRIEMMPGSGTGIDFVYPPWGPIIFSPFAWWILAFVTMDTRGATRIRLSRDALVCACKCWVLR